MMSRQMTTELIDSYKDYLYQEERSKATVEKYTRDLYAFYRFLPEDKIVEKQRMIDYKKYLAKNYKISSANSMLAAVNGFLSHQQWGELNVKALKCQKNFFSDSDRELTKEEYVRLLETAKRQDNDRLNVLMQTICSTGIRVSEHRWITVEAVRAGAAQICNKGKARIVFLVPELGRLLNQYIKKHGIKSGPVFITRNGRPMNRSNIWSEMKNLCKAAGVAAGKVFPHNLRHLFAVTFYRMEKDLVRLADLLGHSNIETTRIYTVSSGKEHRRLMARMKLCGEMRI